MFAGDKLPPNAILIEYIENMQPIGLANFSEDRLKELRQILDDIHHARVLHGDPYPRNMMIVSGKTIGFSGLILILLKHFRKRSPSPTNRRFGLRKKPS